jgi:hypothetical protein
VDKVSAKSVGGCHASKLAGFDTFEGFVDLSLNNGSESDIVEYPTLQNCKKILEEIL